MKKAIEKATKRTWADIAAELEKHATIFNAEIEPGNWPPADALADVWIDGVAEIENVDWRDDWTQDITTACDEILTRLMYPAPTDDDSGFFGVLPRNLGDETTPIALTVDEMTGFWYTACRAVAETFKENDPAVVRNFLRSRWGRHLADEVASLSMNNTDLADAIPQAIGRRTTNGRLAWQTPFTEIRKTTLNGTWAD